MHFRLVDNAANLPPDFVGSMLGTATTNPVFFKTDVEGTWGSFSGMAYTEFDQSVHVVEPFPLPDHWLRFESMDHGAVSPTAWLAFAVDEDGNCVVFDEHYEAGRLVSEHAAEVKRRPAAGWQRRENGELVSHVCFADPSIGASHGLQTQWGRPASVLTEYREHGVDWLRFANNDRVAGYSRLLELIHVVPKRIAPRWAQVPAHAGDSPRLFIFHNCVHVVEQLRSAPVAAEGPDAGKAIDGKWEREHGHAHAALRYGAMSRPSPSAEPVPVDQAAVSSAQPVRGNGPRLARLAGACRHATRALLVALHDARLDAVSEAASAAPVRDHNRPTHLISGMQAHTKARDHTGTTQPGLMRASGKRKRSESSRAPRGGSTT